MLPNPLWTTLLMNAKHSEVMQKKYIKYIATQLRTSHLARSNYFQKLMSKNNGKKYQGVSTMMSNIHQVIPRLM